MTEKPGLGEQAINKAVEMGLASQLDEVENLDVNVTTDPLKLIQGQVDAVQIQGEGMVMQKDLQVEEMEVQVKGVAIDPIKAAFGQIELTKPTAASTRIVLTEAGIDRAFNSEYIRQQLQKQPIHVNGQPMTIEPQQVEFRLPGNGKVALNATILLQENRETKQVAFTAVPRIINNGQGVSLENVEYGEGEELSPDLTAALVAETSEILNLANFDLDGIELKIKDLSLEAGKMNLLAEAYVEKIPTGGLASK
jgi:hypothetical protein